MDSQKTWDLVTPEFETGIFPYNASTSSASLSSQDDFLAKDKQAADAICQRNLQSSNLLRLPAELRLRILSYLVDDIHVHVSAYRKQTDTGIQTRTRLDVYPFNHPPPAYFNNFAAGKWRGILNGNQESSEPCPSCTGRTNLLQTPSLVRYDNHPASFQLHPIWRVCRQFHNEVLGRLFSNRNIFSFCASQAESAKPRFHINLPQNFIEGVTKIWVENVQEIKAHIDDLGVRGLRKPMEIHAARNYPQPRKGDTSIYGISPLWLTDPFEIETNLLEQKEKLWEASGTKLVFHDRP